jgi:hypothetical protein
MDRGSFRNFKILDFIKIIIIILELNFFLEFHLSIIVVNYPFHPLYSLYPLQPVHLLILYFFDLLILIFDHINQNNFFYYEVNFIKAKMEFKLNYSDFYY